MEPELTRESKEAIRAYFLQLIVIPGSIVSIALFFLGEFSPQLDINKIISMKISLFFMTPSR